MKNPTKKQLESEIADLKKVVNNPDTPENILNAVKPTLTKLEKLLEDLSKAEKEDTKIQAQAKVVTAKAEKLIKVRKASSTKKAQPPAAKKPEVKKVNIAAQKSKKKVSDIASEAKKLLSGLAPKIKSFNAGRSEEDLERDQDRKANKPGWKKSKTTGKWYFENRPNRTDASGRQKPYLEDGGEVEMTEKEVLQKYFGANVFPEYIINSFQIVKKSIGDDNKANAYYEQLKSDGFLVKKKSYSEFTAIMGVKKKIFEDGGEVEIMANGGEVNHTIYNYLIVDLDERGEYAATVYNAHDEFIWDCNTEVVSELIEDGFLKYKPDEDLKRLEEYLISIGILMPGSKLISEDEFDAMDDDDNDDDDNEEDEEPNYLFIGIEQKIGNNPVWFKDKNTCIEYLKKLHLSDTYEPVYNSELSVYSKTLDVLPIGWYAFDIKDKAKILDRVLFGKKINSANYAKGGLFKQSAPQGENYRWQNDKANSGAAKPVGWRYTDAGAEKLGISSHKRPTDAHIEKYADQLFKKDGEMHNYLYKETRKDKSDINQHKRLAGGGGVRQTAPQGENYRWQNDKALDTAAKPVGWRYTDEGAKRLNVSTNKKPTQAHIDKFKDKVFIVKGEKHRYIYEETRKDKSDIDQRKHLAHGGDLSAFIGQGENIDVFGYQTKHFIDCPSAVEQFSAAMDTIESQYKPGDQYYEKMKAALATMAEKVDTFFSLEHFYAKREMEEDSFTRISQLLIQIGVYNYKSGLNVNTEFLGRHLEMICHYSKKKVNSAKLGKYAKGGEVKDFALFQQTPEYKKITAEAKKIENNLWPGLDDKKVQELSVAFSDVINEWCTSDELAEINRRNKTPKYIINDFCATHDFYDSNMAMDEAFTKVFKRDFVFFNDEEPGTEEQNEIDTQYFNAAWELSQESQFKNTSASA